MNLGDLRICENCGERCEERFHYGCKENGGAPGNVVVLEDWIENIAEEKAIEYDSRYKEALREALRKQAKRIKDMRQALRWLKLAILCGQNDERPHTMFIKGQN